jgi:hypothetical protein
MPTVFYTIKSTIKCTICAAFVATVLDANWSTDLYTLRSADLCALDAAFRTAN